MARCSCPLTPADWRRIQKSIQVTTPAARSIVRPSKICSYGSSRPPIVRKIAAPNTMEAPTAAPTPIQIFPKWRVLPVRAR